ncbi:MAG: phosphatidylserine decarboxylase family protein [Nitrospina sp.]|jgi:phosphatidylserine decarboxylase|nr:phosphatidylserine decarboxylase family protein [Nitrospina sp.]MBT3414238.1 phosphatidylserine decarboxylase family protein [Nitrospina sp.]MBT3857784.1 phosphatidylserine decarboxylase family protein [Nitrospina sp.]MBT4103387.1 phosphatidylserine decarboxylase family protein [Nitrospina sp.]MBT4390448.1 phosphatidylserine decarboxylase family protein [Nitrospina sp.]
MRIPIAKEGYIFILPLAVLTGIFWTLSWLWAVGLFGGLFLFVTWFFRDPERNIPEDPNAIVSPGDGKVVEIIQEKDPLLDEAYTRVSIFLNVFNVHVNRVPIAGRIQATRYNPGKFLNAASHKASLDNEQSAILLNNGRVTILVKQIAGLIARRIVCWAKEGDEYQRGQRYGLIRFGSRMDVFLPEGTDIKVAIGDIVHGGSSIIGYLR